MSACDARRFGVLVFFALAASSSTARANEVEKGFLAIDAWQMDRAFAIAIDELERDRENPAALALLAEAKLHASDYAGAGHYFRLARQKGAPQSLVADAALAEAAWAATRDFQETIDPHFIIRHSPGKDAILVPYATETLNRARETFRALLGFAPSWRVVVEFYPSAKSLADVSTLTREEIEASGTIALCKWNRLMVTSPRAILLGYAWRDTLAHELAHLVIGGASKNNAPIWLHEGIAKFIETAWRGEPGGALTREAQVNLREAAKKGRLIPFERMHPSMAKLKTQEETSLAFSEVFTFVEFLISLRGWEGIRAILHAMADGQSDVRAIEITFGASLDSLVRRWMSGLKTRAIRDAGGLVRTRNVVVKERPDVPDDTLFGVSALGRRYARAADLLYQHGRMRAAVIELEKAIAVAPSPLLNAKLAVVALGAGDLERSERGATEALRETPDLPGPNVTLAEILLARDKPNEAKEALFRAISVNPFDARIHELLIAAAKKDHDEPAKARHEAALARLGARFKRTPDGSGLGRGGRIQIDATPYFSRVFLARVDDPQREPVATGATTPTAPIDIGPGEWRLTLFPLVGEPITRQILVVPKGPGDAPQRIEPLREGS